MRDPSMKVIDFRAEQCMSPEEREKQSTDSVHDSENAGRDPEMGATQDRADPRTPDEDSTNLSYMSMSN